MSAFSVGRCLNTEEAPHRRHSRLERRPFAIIRYSTAPPLPVFRAGPPRAAGAVCGREWYLTPLRSSIIACPRARLIRRPPGPPMSKTYSRVKKKNGFLRSMGRPPERRACAIFGQGGIAASRSGADRLRELASDRKSWEINGLYRSSLRRKAWTDLCGRAGRPMPCPRFPNVPCSWNWPQASHARLPPHR